VSGIKGVKFSYKTKPDRNSKQIERSMFIFGLISYEIHQTKVSFSTRLAASQASGWLKPEH
jgi:hypothetical protein